jgi:hypothetical protein
MIRGCRDPGRYQETKRGKALGGFLCPDRGERLDSGIGSFFARDRGESLKRLHRPHRFSVWLPEFEGGRGGIHVRTGFARGLIESNIEIRLRF